MLDFTNAGPYALPLDASTAKHKLSPYEQATGWKVVRDTTNGQYQKIRQWWRAGYAFGVQHAEKQRMLTWHVLALQGISSYDPVANPRYAPAIRLMESARLHQVRFGASASLFCQLTRGMLFYLHRSLSERVNLLDV